MRKNLKRLTLNRETLRALETLSEAGLQNIAAAARAALLETRNEPSWCPCTDTCM